MGSIKRVFAKCALCKWSYGARPGSVSDEEGADETGNKGPNLRNTARHTRRREDQTDSLVRIPLLTRILMGALRCKMLKLHRWTRSQ